MGWGRGGGGERETGKDGEAVSAPRKDWRSGPLTKRGKQKERTTSGGLSKRKRRKAREGGGFRDFFGWIWQKKKNLTFVFFSRSISLPILFFFFYRPIIVDYYDLHRIFAFVQLISETVETARCPRSDPSTSLSSLRESPFISSGKPSYIAQNLRVHSTPER